MVYVGINVFLNVTQAAIMLRSYRGNAGPDNGLVEKVKTKVHEYNIDFFDREAVYKTLDKCCFPKVLKEAYETERTHTKQKF